MKEKVLDRADMPSSDFRHYNMEDSLIALPHTKGWLNRSVRNRKIYPYTREHAASSTLNSSVAELSNWMITFLQSIDSTDTSSHYKAMINPSTKLYPYIGLGFQIGYIDDLMTIGHYGGDRGFRSYLIMIPKEKIGLVVLANSDYHEDFRQEILHPIARLMSTLNKN